MSRNLKKGLIITMFVIIGFVFLICRGYFSENVKTLIVVNSKQNSLKHIEQIIKEEVVQNDYEFFSESISVDGVVICAFDSNLANKVLSLTMNKLKEISVDYHNSGEFTVFIPASYLFMPSSYIFPSVKLSVETSNIMYYEANLKTNITEYGINNTLVELIMEVIIKYQIYIPLMVSEVDNQIDIPLAIKLINGKVPEGLFSYQK